MRLLATHVIPHRTGDKRISLYHGDLARIPPSEQVDLLVVSAFPNDYVATSTSLIGALQRTGISVADLAQHMEADLRTIFSCWLSQDLSVSFPTAGFRRILCFETSQRGAPSQTVGDVFRAMMPFALGDPPIESIAMPILATGDQGFGVDLMLTAIFEAATHWMAAGLPLRVLKLVVHSASGLDRVRETFEHLMQSARRGRTESAATQVERAAEYHFFISYAHEDCDEVDTLVQHLTSANRSLRVFQDKLELDAGESWQTEIDRALESCRRVIAVYSPSYLASKVCIEEFNMARVRHRESPSPVLTPIYLRTATLPLYMRTLQFVDCREANRKLLAAATKRLAEGLVS